jgi:hypothetical protein
VARISYHCILPAEGIGVGAGSLEAGMLGIPGDVTGDAEPLILFSGLREAKPLLAHLRPNHGKMAVQRPVWP